MIVREVFSLICNDSNHSISQIWFVNDLSPCYQKLLFGFLLHALLLIFAVYHIGQRSSCSYRLWTFALALIRLASLTILICTFAWDFYFYFFLTGNTIQWIDVINSLLIFLTYLSISYVNLNKNLYHHGRPWCYTIVVTLYSLAQSYDVYRIVIGHITSLESVYISVRQVCLALMSVGLLAICRHHCQAPRRAERKCRR